MATPQGGALPQIPRPASLTPAIIILGADALLAARPASPGQLTNACYAAGYSAVIPSSWGDELVAAACLREIAERGQGSVVLCACPQVAERMRRVPSLMPQLLSLVAPPIAAARYLRARAGHHGVHITFIGDCPGGSDKSIDRHATPGALLRSLAKRGIDPAGQPEEVEEKLLRDARRFYSLPGGAPAPNWLYVEKRGYTLIEPHARDFLAEVAYRVSKRERRVVDLAARLGCACSGAVVGQPWTEARDVVAALEPPRAVHEVLDHDVAIDLSLPLEAWSGSATDGETTTPITLDALAAMHDAGARVSAIRTLTPPRVPRRPRPSGDKMKEPLSLAAHVPPEPIPATEDGNSLPEPVPPASTNGERVRRSSDVDLPVGPPPQVTGASSPVTPPAGPDLPPTPAEDPDVWPEVEPKSRRPRGPERLSEGARWEARAWGATPNPASRWLTVIVSLLLAAAATAAVGALLLGRGSGSSVGGAGGAQPTTAPADSLGSGSSETPSLGSDSSGSRLQERPADSAASATSPGTARADTAAHLAPMPPRLPIGPALVPGHTPDRAAEQGRNRSPRESTIRDQSVVATPGAAPIPRAASPAPGSGAPAPLGNLGGSAGSGAANGGARADAESLRSEIAKRRHRIDSLHRLLDSMPPRTKADSTGR